MAAMRGLVHGPGATSRTPARFVDAAYCSYRRGDLRVGIHLDKWRRVLLNFEFRVSSFESRVSSIEFRVSSFEFKESQKTNVAIGDSYVWLLTRLCKFMFDFLRRLTLLSK